MSLRILHLSDLHTGLNIKKIKDATDRGKKVGSSQECDLSCQNLLAQLKHYLEDGEKIDLLVISGDLISGNKIKTHDIYTQFRAICEKFIKPLKEYLNLQASDVIIVPGNHDVERDETLTFKLDKFFDTIDQEVAITPLNPANKISQHKVRGNYAETNYISLNKTNKHVVIFPVSSSPLGGISNPVIDDFCDTHKDVLNKKDTQIEIPIIDPAYVSPNYIQETKKELNRLEKPRSIKIAVVHHNPLSYQYQGMEEDTVEDDFKKYGFINNGFFNHFLVEHGFHIVLHGHQHRHRVAYFSTDEDINTGNNDIDIVGNGFLCIGAPSFGGDQGLIGYNIIDIDIENDFPNTASVTIRQITCQNAQGVKNSTKTSSYLVPLNKSLKESDRELLAKVKRDIYNGNRLPQYSSIVQPQKSSEEIQATRGHWERLHDRLTKHKEIRAIYSLSVFPPEKWGAEKLTEFFLSFGKINIARAVAMAKKIEHDFVGKNTGKNEMVPVERRLQAGCPSLHFVFSPPLYKAIQLAQDNAEAMNVAEFVRKWKKDTGNKSLITLEARQFLDKASSSIDSANSISIWDNAGPDQVSDLEVNKLDSNEILTFDNMNVTIQSLEETPNHQYNDSPKWLPNLFEFPRILLWEHEDFKRPEAIQCIIFHEECGLPLFWIKPSLLKTFGNNGEKKGSRKKIGYVSIFSRFYSRGKDTVEADDLWNLDTGEEPDSNIQESKKNDNAEKPMMKIWEEDGKWPSELSFGSTLVDEYFLLLQRKDIMFAADVWAMINMGEHTRKMLDQKINADNSTIWSPESDN